MKLKTHYAADINIGIDGAVVSACGRSVKLYTRAWKMVTCKKCLTHRRRKS